MSWAVYPIDDPDDVDNFSEEAGAMNAAEALANGSNRTYRVTYRDRTWTIEPDRTD